MKSLLFGVVLSLGIGGAAIAAAPDAQLTTPIHQFIDDFNKGDAKGAAAAFAPGDVSIIDEVAPHIWRGPGAFPSWSKSLAADGKKNGMTDETVTLGEPTDTVTSGRHAYVVLPATFNFKQHGAAMHETAQMTYALVKGAGGWKIAGWTWSGSPPVAGGK
ncbi:MAG TPA: nuclear transport factor 2 family protein [Caulobacteraceae bacterium]|jgi:ketosteroid isomerase-like protein